MLSSPTTRASSNASARLWAVGAFGSLSTASAAQPPRASSTRSLQADTSSPTRTWADHEAPGDLRKLMEKGDPTTRLLRRTSEIRRKDSGILDEAKEFDRER